MLPAARRAAVAGHEVRAGGRRDRSVRRALALAGGIRTLAVGAVELSLFSVALYVAINEAVFGGPTPYAADVAGETSTDASFPGGYLERTYRLVALFVDRDYGCCAGRRCSLWPSRASGGCSRVASASRGRCRPCARSNSPASAPPCSEPSCWWRRFWPATMFRLLVPAPAPAGRALLAVPLVAWGFRHAPRVGLALAALTVGASAWLYVDVRWEAARSRPTVRTRRSAR